MLIRTDTLVPWNGERIGSPALLHPPNIEHLWTVEALAAVGLIQRVPFVLPAGKRTVGNPTYDALGVETYVTEDIPPPTAEQVDAGKESYLNRHLVQLHWKILFDLVNDVRVLKGQAQLTAVQFRAAMKNLL